MATITIPDDLSDEDRAEMLRQLADNLPPKGFDTSITMRGPFDTAEAAMAAAEAEFSNADVTFTRQH